MTQAQQPAQGPVGPVRRVLLVGASTPIGRAITAAFTAEGHRVVGVSLEPAGDASLVADLVADCSTTEGADGAVEAAVAALGGLDVLVTAAARQRTGPVHRVSDDDWRLALAGTLDTVFRTARAALPRMGPGSAVVVVSSVNATRPAPHVAPYATAKAAVDGLVRSMAVDYAPSGIRVNAVQPAVVPRDSAEGDAARVGGIPLGRVIRPADVADAVTFLASARAAAITGVVLPVDGGLSVAAASTYARPELAERARQRLVTPPAPG